MARPVRRPIGMDERRSWIEVEPGVYQRAEECTAEDLTRAVETGCR